MTVEEERYQQVDLPFYRREVVPALPAQVLDFHAHASKPECFGRVLWESEVLAD